MNYDGSEDSYRCSKTDFHHNRNVVIATGVTKFQGSILKPVDDIDKSLVLVILKESGKGSHDIIKGSEITVHTKLVGLKLETF